MIGNELRRSREAGRRLRVSRAGLGMLLLLFDLGELHGCKNEFDLLQCRAMNVSRLVMLLLIA